MPTGTAVYEPPLPLAAPPLTVAGRRRSTSASFPTNTSSSQDSRRPVAEVIDLALDTALLPALRTFLSSGQGRHRQRHGLRVGYVASSGGALVGEGHVMPKEIKGYAARKPPQPSASHSDIDAWFRRQVPHLQPIVQALDESIRATIPGLHYAVKWEEAVLRSTSARLDHRAGRLRRFRECRLPRRRRLRVPTATRNHRPDTVRQGDHAGGGTTTRAARVDRGGQPHTGLDLKVIAPTASYPAAYARHDLKRDVWPVSDWPWAAAIRSVRGHAAEDEQARPLEHRDDLALRPGGRVVPTLQGVLFDQLGDRCHRSRQLRQPDLRNLIGAVECGHDRAEKRPGSRGVAPRLNGDATHVTRIHLLEAEPTGCTSSSTPLLARLPTR
jgi:hypothetical protein